MENAKDEAIVGQPPPIPLVVRLGLLDRTAGGRIGDET